MKITALKKINKDEKTVLVRMMLDYFAEIDSTKISKSTGKAVLDYPFLDTYWTEEKRFPYFICSKQELIGFVLINDWSFDPHYNADFSIAEFYIKKLYRRKGIGKKIAFDLFDLFEGKWEIRQSAQNKPAIKFWRKTIASFTKNNYEEKYVNSKEEEMYLQLFTSNHNSS